jgi:peptide-methionine (S)-S-oxide reductase
MQKATFGAGCFWGVEAEFKKVKGVKKTTVGYMGGHTKNPTYEDVCTNSTDHVEVLQIEFDENIISYEKLLDIFWSIHDPTQKNGQGPDIGTQYKSVIFYHDENQKKAAEKSKSLLEQKNKFDKAIATEIKAVEEFYIAEEYHQNYFGKNKY